MAAKSIDVGGHRLRVDVSGEGPPDLLCLHGLVDRLEVWDRVVEPLSERGRVVRADQRAHGGSQAPPGPYARADLASDVVTLMGRLGSERAVLVAHSMGGVVSLATALLHPDRVLAMVLIGTASQCSEKVAAWYERISLAGERDGNPGLAREIYGERSRRVVSGDPRGIAHVARMLKSPHSDPLTPRLADIRCPVLLVVGDRDPMGPRASRIIAEQLPGAHLEVVPDCGHWVHLERPRALIDAYDRWAARIPAGGPPARRAAGRRESP